MDQARQQELQQAAARLQQLQSYLQVLEEQTQETANALEHMDTIAQVEPGTPAYVPLTNGIYIKANLEKTNEFLLNTGKNTVTAQSPAEAKRLLQEQQEELRKAQEDMTQQFTELYRQYMELQLKQHEEKS
ncbi:prefoldin subunit alpha [Candidatus Woesearchaeota archaeon]|nr:prefoldin subunit alpha [Candidatus Woesearchaeota archaeon]